MRDHQNGFRLYSQLHPNQILDLLHDKKQLKTPTTTATETGSGKTLAYLLPLLSRWEQIDADLRRARSNNRTVRNGSNDNSCGKHRPMIMVVAPSPELAEQVGKWVEGIHPDGGGKRARGGRAREPAKNQRASIVVTSSTNIEPMYISFVFHHYHRQ